MSAQQSMEFPFALPGHHQLLKAIQSSLATAFKQEAIHLDLTKIQITYGRAATVDILAAKGSEWSAGDELMRSRIERLYTNLLACTCAICGNRSETLDARCESHASERLDQLQEEQMPTVSERSQRSLIDTNQDALPEDFEVTQNELEANDQIAAYEESEALTVNLVSNDDFATLNSVVNAYSKKGSHDRLPVLQMVKDHLDRHGLTRRLAKAPSDRQLAELESLYPNIARSGFFNFLRNQVALERIADGRLALSPIILNGPPGIGKTEVLANLAAMCDVSSTRIDFSGASSMRLAGSEKNFASSDCGAVAMALLADEYVNPILILDEFEKADSERYSPYGTILSLLERHTAEAFSDQSVPEIKLDASHICWFATTNSINGLSSALLSRWTVFNVEAPTSDEIRDIARAIHNKLLAERPAWRKYFTDPLNDQVIDSLAKGSPREIRKGLLSAMGKAARQQRHDIRAEDIVTPPTSVPRQRMGF